MEWERRRNTIEQVGRFVPGSDNLNLPDPLVKRAGIMQSLPSYRISRCMFNNEFILCLVTHGRGWVITKGKRTDLSVGDMFCIFPDVATEYGTHPEYLMHKCWVGFTGIQVATLIDQLGFTPSRPVIGLGAPMQALLPWFNEIRQELLAATPGGAWRATGLLWQILGSMQTMIRRPVNDARPSTELVRQAVRYIDAHFADIDRVSDIAKYTELSHSHFSTLFKQETGHSPLDYLTEVRLAHAERLLSQTSHPIKSIAMSVGIQDQAYFSRLFTLKRGMTPQSYRQFHQSSA